MNSQEQHDLGSLTTRVSHVEEGLRSFTRTITDRLDALSSQMSQRDRPQWQAYGVMVSVVVVLGGLVYWPIREQQYRLEAVLLKMDDQKVDVSTYAVASDRAKETRDRVDLALRDIQSNLVPRREHELQWQANAREMSDMQRQIEEVKRGQADTYTARDVILKLEARQRELEEMILRGKPSGS